MKNLSIIIVSYNVKLYLHQCINSILEYSPQIEKEIIIVDNNSKDGTVSYLNSIFPSRLLIIENAENRGFGKACNQGLQVASHEYVLFLNPDTQLHDDCLSQCVHFLEAHENIGLLGVRMLDEQGRFRLESKRNLPTAKASFFKLFGMSAAGANRDEAYYDEQTGEYDSAIVDVLSGAFMMAETARLRELGGFDETYFVYGEDIDLSYRSLLAGYQNYYLGAETITHYKGKSTTDDQHHLTRHFYQAMQIFYDKHYGSQDSRLFASAVSLGIAFKKSLSILKRVTLLLVKPVVDYVIFLAGFLLIKFGWASYYFNNIYYYSDSGINASLSFYAFLWVVLIALGSGYRHYFRRVIYISQVILGCSIILIIYALLDNSWRSSRAIIGLATLWVLTSGLSLRWLVYYFVTKDKSNLVSAVGLIASKKITKELLRQNLETHNRSKIIAIASDASLRFDSSMYSGTIADLNFLIDHHGIDRLLIQSDLISVDQIMEINKHQAAKGVQLSLIDDYQIPSLLSDRAYDGLGLDALRVSFPVNYTECRVLKRCFDIIIGIICLPISLFSRLSTGALIGCIIGHSTLISYNQNDQMLNRLPKLKKGVIAVNSGLQNQIQIHRLNVAYAMQYSPSLDLKILTRYLFRE